MTGASSGIGAAVADRLNADAWSVVGIDRHHADIVADLSRADDRRRAVAAVRDRSRVDAVVCCAGVSAYGGRAGSELVAVNYFGAVAVADGLRADVVAAGGGAVVLIGSGAAVTAPDIDEQLVEAMLDGDETWAARRADTLGAEASYPASKLALARWARRHAPTREWIGAGVSLNVVAPGMVDTPMIDEMRADTRGSKLLGHYPNPRGCAAAPEEIAAVVAFLLTPSARAVAGSVITVDGGTEALLRPDDWPASRPRVPVGTH